MYIVPNQISLSIYPYVVFPATQVNIDIIHKQTKTTVTALVSYTSINSQVTITLPSLTPINNVANNLDECIIRIYGTTGIMLYEYMYLWVIDSANILLHRKTWTTTANNDNSWITL